MPPFKIYATGEYPPWSGTRYTVVKSMVVKLYGQTVHIERQGEYSYEVKVSFTASEIYQNYLFHVTTWLSFTESFSKTVFLIFRLAM